MGGAKCGHKQPKLRKSRSCNGLAASTRPGGRTIGPDCRTIGADAVSTGADCRAIGCDAPATGPDSQPVRLDCVPSGLVSRANGPDCAGSATDCVNREPDGRKRGTDARATRPDCAGKHDNPRSFSLAFSEKCAPPNRNAERGTRNAERGTRGRKGAPGALCAINNLTGGTTVIGTHGNEPGHERQARFIISGHACATRKGVLKPQDVADLLAWLRAK